MRFFILVFLLIAACSHDETRPEERTEKIPVSLNQAPDAGASIETKQVAAQSNAPFSTEIRFAKGAAKLSKESTSRLDKLLKSALKIGAIEEIHAYAWSDQEYPGEQAKKLPAKSKNLAVARGEAIQAYFAAKNKDLRVEVTTMTERPEGLSETLKMGDTREKEMFANAGVSTTDESKTTAAPKASRAAVMIILKR